MSHTIYFDLETGGINITHPVIQLAAIVVSDADFSECASLECKIKFNEADADPEALALNHYTKEAWADALHPSTIPLKLNTFANPFKCIEMVSKRTGSSYLVGKLAGHNALTFDLPRLRSLYGTNFFPFSYHVKDTLQRALWYFDEHPAVERPTSLKLSVLCEYFGIKTEGAHEALTDVRLSAALARAICMAESMAR